MRAHRRPLFTVTNDPGYPQPPKDTKLISCTPRRPTPSHAAAMTQADKPDPRVGTGAALAIIIGSYLTFFTVGIIRAIQVRDQTLPATDYSTPRNIAQLGGLAAEILGAAVLLYLVCQWLRITRPLAGLPRSGATIGPTVLTTATAWVGLLAATAVLVVLQKNNPDPNALAGGVVHNQWTVPGIVIGSINAGVVEEIVIVAIPVLIGRRAGWHPAVIVALSVFLRWPFHIYHGTWSSLPWTMLWGGSHVIAFLYLRRLIPLVIYHAAHDIVPGIAAEVSEQLGWIILGAYLALVGSWVFRALQGQRRRRLHGPAVFRDPAALTFLSRRKRRGYPLLVVALLAEQGFVTAALLQPVHNPAEATALAAVIVGGGSAAIVWIYRRYNVATNIRAYSADTTGEVQTIASWATDYIGTTKLSITKANRHAPVEHEIAAIHAAAAATQPVSVKPSRNAYQVIATQLHMPARRPLTRRIRLTPTQIERLTI